MRWWPEAIEKRNKAKLENWFCVCGEHRANENVQKNKYFNLISRCVVSNIGVEEHFLKRFSRLGHMHLNKNEALLSLTAQRAKNAGRICENANHTKYPKIAWTNFHFFFLYRNTKRWPQQTKRQHKAGINWKPRSI